MALADNDGDSPPLAVSDQFDRHFATDRQIRDDIGQGIVRRHILAIHPNDDVASLYPRLGGGFARYNLTDEFATILGQARSEEHTSELQSLMRISYAVFCLKKKNEKKNHNTIMIPHQQ